jgi:hypothetical protein
MGYEIEVSIDLRKEKNISALLDLVNTIAYNNNCDNFYKFTDYERSNRKIKRNSHVMIFCFEDEKFVNMTSFLKEIVEKYKKKFHIESIYEIDHNSLIYASSYYMELMEKEQKDNYKHRRQNRSFSETEYFILRDILHKNY